jgi:hypothetical protein
MQFADNPFKGVFMKAIYKFLIHFLITSLVLVPLSINAAMISTDKALSVSQSVDNKNKVNDFFSRSDVIAKFESMGVTPQMAHERINAMTQAEVNQVAKNIDSLPAGGDLTITTAGWIGILVIVGLVAWLYNR